MKMKANKSFHTSGIGLLHKGDEFEVSDALGKEMQEKGLATASGKSTPSETSAKRDAVVKAQPEVKAELPPLNKADFAPKTKKEPALGPVPTPLPAAPTQGIE